MNERDRNPPMKPRPRPEETRPAREETDRTLEQEFETLESALVDLPDLHLGTSREEVMARRAEGKSSKPALLLERPIVSLGLATGLTVGGALGLILGLGFPAAVVAEVAGVYLLLNLLARALFDPDRALFEGKGGRLTRIAENQLLDWGTNFYGVSAVTSLFVAEVNDIANMNWSIAEILSNPIGTAISLFVAGLIDFIGNVIGAALWPFQLFQLMGGNWVLALSVGFVAWLVWWLITDDA